MIELDLNLLIYQFICFSIFAVAIYFLGFRKIVAFLKERQQKLADDQRVAEEKREEAENLRSEYHDKIANIEEEVADIIRKAHDAADKKRTELVELAEKEAQGIVERGENLVALEEARAISDVRGEVADIAVLIASKVLDETRTDEREEKLAAKFLDDLGDIGSIDLHQEQ